MSARAQRRKLQFESLNPRLTMAGDLDPSYVAVLRGSANTYDASKGPQIAQAGFNNYNSTTVSVGFAVGGVGPASINDVKYYYFWS